jgi:hypothetical protein
MTNRVLARILLTALVGVGCCRKPNADAILGLETRFQAMMSGVTLVGHSTLSNGEGVSGEERYVIDKVSKPAGDTWLLHTRIQYG